MNKKWLFADYYDTTIILLALISVILVLLGFAEMIDLDNPPYSIIDLVIWGVFVIDYSWRFLRLKENGALFLKIFLIYWLFSL
ncbi:ion transporter [Streptococcus pneumoniae]|nr:ion transporter [Streptococcus pneumoniae]